MRNTTILLAAACLVAGCHRDAAQQTATATTSEGRTSTQKQTQAPALNPNASPMKANDIDAIAAEVKERDKRSRHASETHASPPATAAAGAPVAQKAPQP